MLEDKGTKGERGQDISPKAKRVAKTIYPIPGFASNRRELGQRGVARTASLDISVSHHMTTMGNGLDRFGQAVHVSVSERCSHISISKSHCLQMSGSPNQRRAILHNDMARVNAKRLRQNTCLAGKSQEELVEGMELRWWRRISLLSKAGRHNGDLPSTDGRCNTPSPRSAATPSPVPLPPSQSWSINATACRASPANKIKYRLPPRLDFVRRRFPSAASRKCEGIVATRHSRFPTLPRTQSDHEDLT